MFGIYKKKCTSETKGMLIKKRWDGDVWFLSVEYVVNGQKYICKEQLRYKKIKNYEVASIPVGFKMCASLESIDIGAHVRVCYNPDKPKKSYLPDNKGMTVM